MKQSAFFENARLLSQAFDILPLLYGSLGLEYITGESLHAEDIDILIPEVFITARWDEFVRCLINEGYVLTDEREHTFEKDGISYSYASVEELETFADIALSDIQTLCRDGVRFRILSLAQYLTVYRTSVRDGYRIHVRQKKDTDKIAFIEKQLTESTLEELLL